MCELAMRFLCLWILSFWASIGWGCPDFGGDFTAVRTISDRGRLYEWNYHVSSRGHETDFFGKACALEVTVADPLVVRQYWLKYDSKEIFVAELGNHDNSIRRIAAAEALFKESLATINQILELMMDLKSENGPLSELSRFLKENFCD